MSSKQGRELSGALVVAVLLSTVLALGTIMVLAALPGAGAIPVQATLPTTFPQPAPTGPWLTCNNPKLGDLWSVDVHAPPASAAWILASVGAGPTTIAGQTVGLGPGWFVLRGMEFVSGSGLSGLDLPLPSDPALLGASFIVQGAVVDPPTLQLSFTDHAALSVSAATPQYLHVLIVRQGFPTIDAPFAPAAAQQLALALQQQGIDVTVHDNVLPPVLTPFDCILDLRFNAVPAQWEKAVMADFVRHQGGLLLVHGPHSNQIWSIQRYLWIEDLVQNRLGIATTMYPGGNSAWQSVETVDPGAPFEYLNNPASIAGTPYRVTAEGGSFGAPGVSAAGSPWITSTGGWAPIVYGMLFGAGEITAHPAVGGVAVLFNGAPDAFTASSSSPAPDLVFTNLCWWLDA